MSKILIVLVFCLSIVYSEKIEFSIGSTTSKVMDIEFEFSEEGKGIISVKINQLSSRGSDMSFMLEEPKNSYVAFLKWLIKLTSAEMRGFESSVKVFDKGVDVNASIDRLFFEIKDIDIFIDDELNNVALNSLNTKFSMTNLKFNVPFLDDKSADKALEKINKAIPDGKVSKAEIAVNYNKQNSMLRLNGILRMLGGNANLDIDILIDENYPDATYIKSASLKLKNLSEGMIDFVDVIEKETSIKVERIGRSSANLDYSGPIKNLPSGEFKQTSYASEARMTISNIHNSSKMYYQIKGEWPGDVEQLERAGQLDLNRSTKMRWTFELQLPNRLIATSTEEMQAGAGKIVLFDALTGKFYGYGSDENKVNNIGEYDNMNNLVNKDIVCIKTSFGNIKLRVFPELAPKHVESFMLHIKNGYYNGTIFHRVIPGFMIQGGDPLTKSQDRSRHGTGGNAAKFFGIGTESNESTWNLPAEFSPTPHVRGILSMARSQSPDSGGSQFFICVDDARFLDNQYTVFGEVIEGIEVADEIVNLPRDPSDNPDERVNVYIDFCE